MLSHDNIIIRDFGSEVSQKDSANSLFSAVTSLSENSRLSGFIKYDHNEKVPHLKASARTRTVIASAEAGKIMLHILADLGFGDVTQAIESDTKILYKDGYGFVCDDGKAEIRLVSLISAALVQK